MATPSFGEVEECLHFCSVAVVGHSTDGDNGVTYRQQREVGAGEVHLGSRGGDARGLPLKSFKKLEAFYIAVWFNTSKHRLNKKYLYLDKETRGFQPHLPKGMLSPNKDVLP